MFKLFKVFLILTMLFLASWETYGQVVYTTSGLCPPNQSNYFGTPNCWIKSGTNCNPGIEVPPVSSAPGCQVTVEINHAVNLFTFNLGSDITLIVNSGGSLNISGSMNQTKEITSRILVDGGDINVAGNMLMLSGKAASKTSLDLDILNGGTFNVGGLLDVQSNSNLTIDGDGNIGNSFVAQSLDLGIDTQINVLLGGRLVVKEDVDYRGNNSAINVYGFFRTEGNFIITGGKDNQLNTYDSASVIIEGDLDLRGDAEILFGGDSEIDIGGNINVDGGATVTATGTSKVYYCGTIEGNTLVEDSGQFIPSCRLLPVDYLYVESEYSKVSNSALLSWATAKEWENSRFEIERSLGDISDFIKIGEVSGMGWKDTITEYKYVDTNLPLSGGNIYYRLKQVDNNGEFSLSKVSSVKMPPVQFTQGVWRAYPNPTDGHQFRIGLLDISQYSQEKISFRIIQPNHVTEVVSVDSEAEMNEYLIQILPTISSGIFVVELQWGQKIEHIKVLKQK